MVVDRSALALAFGSLLLLSSDACVLTAPDIGAPLRQLRAEQRAQVDTLASAFCTTYYDCGCMETYPIYEGENECVEHITELLLGHLEQGINDELEYDHDCLDATIEMLEGIGCVTADMVTVGTPEEALLDAAFQCRMYNGDKALGDECVHLVSARGDECGLGLACHDGFSMCFDNTFIAEDEPCGLDERRCDSGMICGWSMAAGQDVCQRPVALGASCAVSPYCEHDAYCDDQQQCSPLPRADEPCATQLGPDVCAAGHRCGADGICELGASQGELCGTCRLGLTCNGEGGCVPARSMICDMESLLP